jgi:hypothetical protein
MAHEREIERINDRRNLLNLTKTMIGELIEGENIEDPEQLEERI